MKINDIMLEAPSTFWGGVAKGLGAPQVATAINANAAANANVPDEAPATQAPAPTTPPVNYNIPAYKRQNKNIPGVTQPAPTPAPEPITPVAAPAVAAQQSKIGVGQINKIIPTLRTRDLTSVKKTVDATLAKKSSQQAAAPTAAAAPTLDEPVSTGVQKMDSNNPTDAKIPQKIQTQPPVAESIDLAEVLWRKMKSKR